MIMKTCPKCSRENPDSARFCAGCGTSLISPMEAFLTVHDLSKLLKTIEENDFHDPKDLLTLTDADLGELGLSLGDKIRLRKALDTLRSEEEVDEEVEGEDHDDEVEGEDDDDEDYQECTGFTLTTETDITLFDPSVEDIKRLVWDDDERGVFLILEHGDDGRFMQALMIHQEDSGGFELEFNDATGENHFATTELVSRHELLDALVKYGTGDTSWRKSHAWKKKQLEGVANTDNGHPSSQQVDAMLQNLPVEDRVYVIPNIPNDKRTAAFNSYVKTPGAEFLLLYDVTVFGGAKDGFVITKDGLYLKDSFEKAQYYAYSNIKEVKSVKTKLFINSEKVMACTNLNHAVLNSIVSIIKQLSNLNN